jgi:sugar lactone lactonase YvrE
MYLISSARGVVVDENGAVYVSDSRNHRVVKWTVGAAEGIIVAGGNGNGSGTDQLTIPGGIIMDERGTIYIADEQNHRVISFPMGTRNGIVVAGGHGPGAAANQLNYLITLAFSPKGDLFVSDLNNFRIQKFEMDKNPSSGSDYIYNHYSKWTLISCFLFSMISIANLLK